MGKTIFFADHTIAVPATLAETAFLFRELSGNRPLPDSVSYLDTETGIYPYFETAEGDRGDEDDEDVFSPGYIPSELGTEADESYGNIDILYDLDGNGLWDEPAYDPIDEEWLNIGYGVSRRACLLG